MRLFVTTTLLFLWGWALEAEPRYRLAVMQVSEKSQSAKTNNTGLAKNLCAKANVECDIVSLPNTRAFKELQSNNVQFVMSLDHQIPGMTLHKLAKANSVDIVVVAKKPTPNCESLKGMNLASFRNVFYAKKLAERCPGLQLTWTNTYAQGWKMYRSGRVDGMIGVHLNFNGSPRPTVRLGDDDIVSLVGKEDIWIFANDTSKDTEAATNFQAVLKKDRDLHYQE
ncbi:substrate-binding periplasmic protein [Oligoflexus tunisiensis]|uniref:substrate-binding periplasmic protein n=1 Tax=Oligoflexus tunisiensis TaxID=708132 RepID=UPI001C402168|nr:transporter substrate-binding domain-containing protein [Oligoflexus tunisiensis]